MKQQTREEALGDRAKMFERIATEQYLIPELPVMLRLDGKAFHTVTRKLERPLCVPFREAMVETTKFLVQDLHAAYGYTQSDEITLGFYNCDHLFKGKIHKILSTSAGGASSKFAVEVSQKLPSIVHYIPRFDARVWNVPTLDHAIEALLFRVYDCIRCSINMLASSEFQHRDLEGVDQKTRIAMLAKAGKVWEDMPETYKYGTFVQRVTEQRLLTPEELEALHPKARVEGPVIRSSIKEINLGDVTKMEGLVKILYPKAFDVAEEEVTAG